MHEKVASNKFVVLFVKLSPIKTPSTTSVCLLSDASKFVHHNECQVSDHSLLFSSVVSDELCEHPKMSVPSILQQASSIRSNRSEWPRVLHTFFTQSRSEGENDSDRFGFSCVCMLLRPLLCYSCRLKAGLLLAEIQKFKVLSLSNDMFLCHFEPQTDLCGDKFSTRILLDTRVEYPNSRVRVRVRVLSSTYFRVRVRVRVRVLAPATRRVRVTSKKYYSSNECYSSTHHSLPLASIPLE